MRIGGVPEHFNLPWHIARENGLFQNEGIEIDWKDYPTGTGAMCTDLAEGKLDLAVVLTEGVVAAIAKGNPSRIVSFYVETPLIWGIHTSSNSDIRNINDLKGRKFAISRFGSGSHLMAFVHARSKGFHLQEDQFVVVNDLNGARKALADGAADLFMWEKFMTKPFVDSGEFNRIGECPTPWPCFAVAVSDNFLKSNKETVKKVLAIVQKQTSVFKNDANSIQLIVNKFGLKTEDAKEWISGTKWSNTFTIEESIIDQVQSTLNELKLIPEIKLVSEYLSKL